MKKLTRDELMGLEQYATERSDFRSKVMAHKKNRQVQIGEHATLYFEDRLTIQYQIQEMLRVERIFEAAGIQEELDAYNPLIPHGSNWTATFMIEYSDENERKVALSKLIGIEDKVWVQVEGFDRVYAIADEDLERNTEEKTSAVHFLRFELGETMVAALKGAAAVNMGIEHENYHFSVMSLPQPKRDSLCEDLD